MKKALLFVFLASTTLSAQVITQIDNYSGSNQVYLNPSAIAGSKWKSYFNVGLAGLGSNTSAFKNETIPFSGKSIKLGGNNHNIDNINLYGPALMVQLRNNHAFSINTRYVSSQSLLSTPDFASWANGKLNGGNTSSLGIDQNAFLEYGLYYAAPVFDQGRHYLKVGVGLSFLKGGLYSKIRSSGDFNYANSDLNYTLNTYQTFTTAINSPTDFKLMDYLMGKFNAGSGKAFSGGLTYEFRKKEDRYHYTVDGKVRTDPSENAYLVKVGLSLNNIGAINYDGTLSSATAQTGSVSLNTLEEGTTNIVNQIESSLNATKSPGTHEYKLPRNFVAQADINFHKNWYAGIAHINNSNSSKTYIGPRKESYDGGFSLMAIYDSFTKKVGWGANFRGGIFTIGSENIEGFFSKKANIAQVFVGVSLPLKRAGKRADRDGDSVSDVLDQCPDIPGFWAFKGCPDTDGDGIEDRVDACPNEAGPKETNGCPDSDGDGIFDKNDACPHAAGSAKLNGCPDTDGDGIPDQEDKCPEQAGLPENGGCPDTDGDGYIDKEDACPTEKGIKALSGCALMVEGAESVNRTLLKTIQEELSTKTRYSSSLVSALQQSKPLNFIFSGENREKLLELASDYKDSLPEALATHVTFTVRVESGRKYTLIVEEK